MKFSIIDNSLLAHSLPMNTDRRESLPLSKMRNKKKEPPSSTENSKDFDSTKKKREPPMTANKDLLISVLKVSGNKQGDDYHSKEQRTYLLKLRRGGGG